MINNEKQKREIKIFLKCIMFVGIMIGLLLLLGVVSTILKPDGVEITKNYNETIANYNALVEEYNAILKNCCVDNIDGMGEYEFLLLVSEEKEDIQTSFEDGNTVSKIKSDINTIKEWSEILSNKIVIVKQIINPTEEWIIERLKKIEIISDIEGVTQGTDINGMLGKEGGYTTCIYFGVKSIDTSSIFGDNIVEKGTDAGGAIEVYATVEDAEARCEYLSEYENTLLYSGSYAIVGTMVIRTSYKLTSEEQLEMTDLITKEFTKIY